jgi:hypothetical protein
MRRLPRLESEPKSGAIFAQLFISAALNFFDFPVFRAYIRNLYTQPVSAGSKIIDTHPPLS